MESFNMPNFKFDQMFVYQTAIDDEMARLAAYRLRIMGELEKIDTRLAAKEKKLTGRLTKRTRALVEYAIARMLKKRGDEEAALARIGKEIDHLKGVKIRAKAGIHPLGDGFEIRNERTCACCKHRGYLSHFCRIYNRNIRLWGRGFITATGCRNFAPHRGLVGVSKKKIYGPHGVIRVEYR